VVDGLRVAALALFLLGGSMNSASSETFQLLALGDSLTSGWGLRGPDGFCPRLEAALRARGLDVRVMNAGVAGDTAAGGLARLRGIPTDAYDAVIVELGINDLLSGVPIETTRRNLEAILDTIMRAGKPVLLAGARSPFGPARVFEKLHRELAETRGIDLDPDFLAGAVGPGLDQGDGLHPNAKGVEVIVERILPRVVKLIEAARAQK